MQKKMIGLLALAFLMVVWPDATCRARARSEKTPYPAMAPLNQYLMPDENSEIALARSAAPASISDARRSDGAGTERIHDRGEGQEWFPLHRGTIMGCRHQ